jgi:hypothetical protein
MASELEKDTLKRSTSLESNGPKRGDILDDETLMALEREQDAHQGVKKVEAAQKVYSKRSKWWLYLGCAFIIFMRSFDLKTLLGLHSRRTCTPLMDRQHTLIFRSPRLRSATTRSSALSKSLRA